MKKGFTLIEIIGIIILLSLIGLLVYPTIMRIIGDSKEDLYQKNISEIERMAANWASINEDKLPKVDKRGYYLKIEEMEKEGFIDGDVTNPKTGEAMQGCVGIIYNEEKNRHDYKYYDDCENFVKPILSNLVANVVENEYGWRNKDFYVTLESEYLDYYDYCISDDKCEPSIRSNESNSPILVNQEGIKYVCAKGANTVGETTTECLKYRLDKTKPVVGNIVFTGTQGLDNWYIGDVLVSNTKSTDALSGIASNTLSPTETSITVDTKGKTYTLTARDLAGNESSVSYTVKVDKTAPTVGELVINGTLGDNGWYKSNVTFSVKDGSDTTSGHNSTVSNITSITSNTTGTNVIITSTDNAGNKSTRTYTLKVDKDSPVLTAKASSVSEVERATDKNKSTLLYFNTPVYSISGGSVSCSISDIKGLSIGTYTITCKATGGNGKTTTASTNLTITQMTLVDKIKYDNPVIASNQTWTGAWTTSDPSGLYSENRYTDSGTTYYFRGQPNNYMTFAGQKFRIIRINEDGSVRLFLESGIGIYKFNSNYNIDKEYSGYTLSYYSTSEIKNNVDSWYNNISSDYKTKLASPTNKFCEAARAGYREGLDYVGPVKLTLKENYTPTFTCPTDGNGHGSLSYNVGLLTYDEALYAGGWYSGSPAFYLNDDKRFWTMSPSGVLASDNYPSDWGVSYYNSNTNNDGYLDNFYLATEMTAKPVINIKGDLIVTGYGTSSDPYVYTIK